MKKKSTKCECENCKYKKYFEKRKEILKFYEDRLNYLSRYGKEYREQNKERERKRKRAWYLKKKKERGQ